MNPFAAIAIFIMIWWVIFFMILPLWSRSHAETGIEVTKGGDPGAPVVTHLKKKLIYNTIIAFVVWVILMLALIFHWFKI